MIMYAANKAPGLHACKLKQFSLVTAVSVLPGPAFPDGELACAARVHFPGAANITEAAVAAAVTAVPPGYGRLNRLCAVLCALAEGRTMSHADGAAAAGCAAKAADETAALHVFSNPLYSVATPKHVC